MRTLLILVFLTIFFLSVIKIKDFSGNLNRKQDKITGISFVAPVKDLNPSCFESINEIGARWIAFMPYAYGKFGSSGLSFNNYWQWWGEKYAGIRDCVEEAKSKDFKVMVKPQIWFREGKYTGDFELNNNLKWKEFEKHYEKYVLDYARLSDSLKVDVFCIGTELKTFVLKRPEFWFQLIQKCREIYKGQLVYAGNWDSFDKIPFWSLLDYVGIDSYFPLSDNPEPTLMDLKTGWENYLPKIEEFARGNKKKIIFTEFGYRSIDFCAKAPWDASFGGNVNLHAQTLAYESFFQIFWHKNWFAGGFVWKWHENHAFSGGPGDNRFTPQNKPASDVIKKYYNKKS